MGLWVVQLSVCHTEEILQGTVGAVESYMEGSHLHARFMVFSKYVAGLYGYLVRPNKNALGVSALRDLLIKGGFQV